MSNFVLRTQDVLLRSYRELYKGLLLYSKYMLGFNKKRFLVTLGLSVVIWVISIVAQFIFNNSDINYGFFTFAKTCEVTGYPFARCIPQYDKSAIYFSYLVNILFWFWIIHLFWNRFTKQKP